MTVINNSASTLLSKKKEVVPPTIGDLPGIGPALSIKLQEAGFKTLESIATVSLLVSSSVYM